MDLTSLKNLKNLLKSHRLRPSQRFGQNFLIDKGAVKKIVEAADLKPEDTVLEIGPGLGTLTQELAKKARRVVAIEKDRNMIKILKETLKDFKNVDIVQGDIRKSDIWKYKIIGNLPFYLTAPVIRQFLELSEEGPPTTMVLVVQKEVGQRICAKPPDMNLLAVSVQVYAEPKIISYISKKSFWPQPEVDAAIIKITLHNHNRNKYTPVQLLRSDRDLFFKIVKAGFSQPRKQLINNLSAGLKIDKKKAGEWLLQNNIQPSQRAETLNIEDWLKLTCFIRNRLSKP